MAVGIDGGSIFGPPEIAVSLRNSLNPGQSKLPKLPKLPKRPNWQAGRLEDWSLTPTSPNRREHAPSLNLGFSQRRI